MELEKQIAGKRALIVEDDASVRAILRRVLLSVSPQIEIEWVGSAEEALPKIKNELASRKNTYDLIIADIFLEGSITGIDFWQTCEALCPHASILVMSSMAPDHFFKAIAGARQAPPFLSKPFHTGDCRKIVAELLGEAGGPPC
jgi:DNA-binding NtrC family response regulator